MTKDEVLGIADRVIRPAFAEGAIEEIAVREDEDWTGDPSLYVDVYLAPDAALPEVKVSSRMRLALQDGLLATGEQRFAYVRLRDRAEEAAEADEVEHSQN